MHEHIFDALSRRAGGVISRRSSLSMLGGAVAAATGGSTVVQATSDRKKSKRRIRRTCGRQVDQCEEAFSIICDELPECDPRSFARLLPCCSLLTDCGAGEALDCLFSLVSF